MATAERCIRRGYAVLAGQERLALNDEVAQVYGELQHGGIGIEKGLTRLRALFPLYSIFIS